MALKDWKKTKNTLGVKDWVIYKDKKCVGVTVEISKNTEKNTWIVYNAVINTPYILIIKKGIKTKSQALKFARAYMRKN